MSQQTLTSEDARRGKAPWSVEMFERFWAAPDPALVAAVLTDDVIGHWPWSEEPVRGADAYVQAIADVVRMLPGMHLEVAEHATNGEFTFVRWVLHATGANGPFTLSGIDRIRLRDGLVAENYIRFDTARLRALLTGENPTS